MLGATPLGLRLVQGQQRVALFACAAALSFACGDKFTAVDTASGGSSGSPTQAGSSSGGSESDAGMDSGGSASGGRGGSEPVAGVAGKAGTSTVGGGPSPGGTGGIGGVPIGGMAGGGGGAPLPPIPTDGLELWLRADEGVTQSASGVSVWKDSSGKQRDAAQIAVNYRPQWGKDALAGKPALVFDGVDDFLKLPSLSVGFDAGVSVFVMMQQQSLSTCMGYFEASNGSEVDDLHFGDWQNSLLFEVEENWLNDTNFPLALNEPRLAAAVQDSQAMVLLRSNSNGAGGGMVNLPAAKERQQVFIGRSLYADCSPFAGSIGEVILYSRGVSDPEIVQIEGYLQTKWGCCDK